MKAPRRQKFRTAMLVGALALVGAPVPIAPKIRLTTDVPEQTAPKPVRTSRGTNAFAATSAVVCWLALIVQLYASVQGSHMEGGSTLDGVWTCLAFFTVLTNLLAALLLTVPLIAPQSAAGRFFAQAETIAGVTVNVALVCIAYNLLLRGTWNEAGLERVADELLHDVVPPLVIAYAWWKAREKPVALAPRLRWAIWPALYFAYALLRGAATGFYPYPFMDVADLGYFDVFENAVVLLGAYAVLAAILLGLDRLRWRPLLSRQ